MTGWAPGPGRARKCARSAGGGPGEPFLAGPGLGPGLGLRLGLRPAPREASVEAPRRPASSAREGASAGREQGERAELSPLFLGRFTWRPQPQ